MFTSDKVNNFASSKNKTVMEEIKLYKYKNTYMNGKILFGNNKAEYDRHFHHWRDWCIEAFGNANIKVNGNNYKITFKHNGKRFKAEWIEY